MQMRIDELANRAGVPNRTIRYYCQQGLLAPPILKGRIGYYDSSHLDRLKLIRELREKRFLPLSVIGGVVKRYEVGEDLETMLAPLDRLFAPQWDAGQNDQLTRDQLAEAAGVSEQVVAAAEDMGFLFPERQGRERSYTSDDVHVLEIAEQWMEMGLPKDLGRLYRRSFEQISKLQVEAFNQCIAAPLADRDLSANETKDALIDGYKSMGRIFDRLAQHLHRKLLQKAVESYAQLSEDSR